MNLGCALNPVGCANDLLAGVPWDYVLWSLAIGMVVGAILGRVGVGAVLAIVAGFAFLSKKHEEQKAAEAPKVQPKPKRKTLVDLLRR